MARSLLFWLAVAVTAADQCCWCGKRYFQGVPQLANESDYVGVPGWRSAVVLDKGFYALGLDDRAHLHVHLARDLTNASLNIRVGDQQSAVVPLTTPVASLKGFNVYRVALDISLRSDTTTTVEWQIMDSNRIENSGTLKVVVAASIAYLERVQAVRIVHRADGQNRWIERFEHSSESPKRWFPYGWFTSWSLVAKLQPGDAMDQFVGNTIHPVSPYEPGTPEDIDRVLKVSADSNIPWMFDMRHMTQNATALAEQVLRHRESPGIFSWYIADEPDGAGDTEGLPIGIPPSDVRTAFQTIKNLDPFHPVSLTLNCQYSAPLYADSADLLMVDPYPVAINTTFCSRMYGCCGCDDCVGQLTDVSQRLDFVTENLAHSKVVHFVGQGFGGAEHWSRAPSTAEFRAMTYLAAVHDAAGGMSYWIQGEDADAQLVQASKDLYREIATISELTYAPTSMRLALDSNSTQVHMAGWCSGEAGLLAIVNPLNTSVQGVSIEISNLLECSSNILICPSVRPLFGGGSPAIANQELDDSVELLAFGTRVYQLSLKCDEGSELLRANSVN